LSNGGLEDRVRTGVCAECVRTIAFLSNITSIKVKDKCPYQLIFGNKDKLPASLRIFGEIGIVNTKDDIQGNLKNLCLTFMFVGYSVANDIYRILNLSSTRIIQKSDAVLLGKILQLLASG
jgi:hypothetical protein